MLIIQLPDYPFFAPTNNVADSSTSRWKIIPHYKAQYVNEITTFVALHKLYL